MKKTLLLIVLQLAASGADAYYTNRDANLPRWKENDPIARPFTHSQTDRIIYFSTTAGIQIALPRLIHHRHPKLSQATSLVGIADNAAGAIRSATH